MISHSIISFILRSFLLGIINIKSNTTNAIIKKAQKSKELAGLIKEAKQFVFHR